MSYASTAQTGTLERQSSGGFGKKVGAAVLTVAVGAAIAAGITFTSSDVSSTGTEMATADRVLASKAPSTDQSAGADRVLASKAPNTDTSVGADRVLASKAPAATSSWGYPTTVEDLVEQGHIPPQSQPTPFSESPGQPR